MQLNESFPDPYDDFDPELEGLLDEEFDLGDGTADTAARVVCPYCGEENEVAVDPGSGAAQDYVEDCQVCCRPWRVIVRFDLNGTAWLDVQPLDDI